MIIYIGDSPRQYSSLGGFTVFLFLLFIFSKHPSKVICRKVLMSFTCLVKLPLDKCNIEKKMTTATVPFCRLGFVLWFVASCCSSSLQFLSSIHNGELIYSTFLAIKCKFIYLSLMLVQSLFLDRNTWTTLLLSR